MRLFIAFELPAAWRDVATHVQSALRTATTPRFLRFVDPDLMHLTLHFLGEVDSDAAARLTAELDRRLADVDVALALGAGGTFGPAARTAVAWLGVDGDRAALDDLVLHIEAAVTAAGLPAEARPFRPHLTLARVARAASAEQRRAIAATVASLDPPPPSPTRFRELVVVRSYLGGAQPRYEVRSRHTAPAHGDPLRPADSDRDTGLTDRSPDAYAAGEEFR